MASIFSSALWAELVEPVTTADMTTWVQDESTCWASPLAARGVVGWRICSSAIEPVTMSGPYVRAWPIGTSSIFLQRCNHVVRQWCRQVQHQWRIQGVGQRCIQDIVSVCAWPYTAAATRELSHPHGVDYLNADCRSSKFGFCFAGLRKAWSTAELDALKRRFGKHTHPPTFGEIESLQHSFPALMTRTLAQIKSRAWAIALKLRQND